MFLIFYLLKASLVLAILTTAYACLVKRETLLRVNRWLLWMNVAASLLLPVIPMPAFDWMPDAPAQMVSEVLPKVTSKPEGLGIEKKSSTTFSSNISSPEIVNKKQPLSFWDWVKIGYGLMVCVLMIRFLVQLAALWRLKSSGLALPIADGFVLIESDRISSPFSFFHWIFYNPTHHTNDEWTQILAHERIHAQQWHSIDIVGAEILKMMFWFNPFAWWHQRLVQETLEFITDCAVLDSGIEKKSYQYHLLRSTLTANKEDFTKSISTPYFNKSTLKNRITMMNRTKSDAWAAHHLEYLQIHTINRLGGGSGYGYNKMSLKTLKEEGRKSININMDDNGFISIAEKRRNDTVLLNGNPSTIGEIEKIKVENLYSAIFKDTGEKEIVKRINYILVFTEN